MGSLPAVHKHRDASARPHAPGRGFGPPRSGPQSPDSTWRCPRPCGGDREGHGLGCEVRKWQAHFDALEGRGGACRVAGAEGHRPADASAPNAGREAGGRGLARPRSRAGSLSLASVKRSGTCPRGGAVLFHGGRSHLPETHSASRSLPPSALSSGRAALPGCSVLGAALRGPRGRGRGHSVCPRCPHAAQAQRGRLVGPCRDWSRFPCGLSAPQTPASLSRGPLTLRAGLALAERVLRRVLGTCVAGTCREASALAPWW